MWTWRPLKLFKTILGQCSVFVFFGSRFYYIYDKDSSRMFPTFLITILFYSGVYAQFGSRKLTNFNSYYVDYIFTIYLEQ